MIEDLKESYYLGCYTKVVNDSTSFRKEDEEVEFIVLRSRLALNQIDFVLNATRSQANNVQKGINMLANALKLQDDQEILNLLDTADKSLLKLSDYYAICIAIIHLRVKNYTDALMVLNGVEHDEAVALRIQSLISINRIDLAESELPDIKDPNLSKVCAAHIGIVKGGDSARDSLYSIQDISDRGISTPLLQNMLAACFFAVGEWENASSAMIVASEKFTSDETTIINQAVALSHGTDYEKLQTQLNLVRSLKNPYTAGIEEMLKDFDQTAARLQAD
ncbi:Coatomer epsilon subunit family protein [Tritrichomonas foetus]|uniref:Coatomer epsilon subunit family protein n=1 Tax=Tritrichomonas foetus TaxID=1144522 RepID=A0A1J4JDU0_9EUKA|nr:Coatomer epsilon subunit family protein [Tritrichomonas foetus]|eukprot:OHS95420.1 Coatomer epsilon subunit family protein [Tritrichomonas foetus]